MMLWIENVIMSWSIENMNARFCSLRKVMVIHLSSFPSVHVLHPYAHTHCCCQSTDVNVVTLMVHWFHLLHVKSKHVIGLVPRPHQKGEDLDRVTSAIPRTFHSLLCTQLEEGAVSSFWLCRPFWRFYNGIGG